MREFDTEVLGIITAFENMTGTRVRDCITNDMVYFLVDEGKIAVAIGKGGQTIKMAEKSLRRSIKIFEWAEEPASFVKKLIPNAQKVDISGDRAIVSLSSKDRGGVIGKNGSNVKILRELLERNSDIKDLKIL